MNHPLPPRLAERLLVLLLPHGVVEESMRGDLREEYAELRMRRVAFHADAWYWWAALRLVLTYRLSKSGSGSATRSTLRNLTMGHLLTDLKVAARRLTDRPMFASVTVLSLGLALGTTTAIYAMVTGVLFAPLPYADSERFVTIRTNTGGTGWYGSSVAELLDIREQIEGLDVTVGYVVSNIPLGDSINPQMVGSVFATADLLPMLGVAPILGRFYTVEEDLPGAAPTTLIGESLWRNKFGADPNLIGATIDIGGAQRTVVGVMPASFAFPTPSTQAWLPYRLTTTNPNRSNHFLSVVGRLSEGTSIGDVRAEMDGLVARSTVNYPQNYSERGYRVKVESMLENVVGASRAPLLASFGAAALLLIIGVVNVATLVVARTEERRREISVRKALGASSWRIAVQTASEGVLLALGGGVIGSLIAYSGTGVLLSMAPASMPRLHEVSFDYGAFLFFALLLFGCASALSLIPLRSSSGMADSEALAGAGNRSTATRAGRRLRIGLVASQIALSVSLAVGALLMGRTLMNLASVEPGVEPNHVLTMRLNPPFAVYQQPAERAQVWRVILDEVQALNGVEAAAAVVWLPFAGPASQWAIAIEGRPVANIGEAPDSYVQQTTPGYFRAMGIRLLEGRVYGESDGADAPPVVVVNEAMANRFWPGVSPLGKRFRVFDETKPWLEVIGVVADVRNDGLTQQSNPRFYAPHAQGASAQYFTAVNMTLVARVAGDPEQWAAAIADAVRQVDSSIPITQVATMNTLLAASIDRQSFTMLLLGVFGAVAVILAALGVYGVMSYSASLRGREYGLRAALGASPSDVMRLAMRESLLVTAAGIAVGLGLALTASRFLQTLLFDIGSTDPVTIVAVVALISAVASLSGFVPARRAANADPMEVLREE